MKPNKRVLEHELDKWIEVEVDKQRELEKNRLDEAQRLKEFIDENPKEFIRLMCKSVLGIEDEKNNPFFVGDEHLGGVVGRSNLYVQGLAKIILNKVSDDELSPVEDGFESFENVVADNFSFSDRLESDEIVKDYYILYIRESFFGEYAGDLASAIDMACQFVFEGVPLYRKKLCGQGYELLSFDDPLYHYIYKKGQYFESGATIHVPNWVDGLFFKSSDFDSHNALFSGTNELEDSERDVRRSALWREIGIDKGRHENDEDQDRRKHRTKLLDATQLVIDRYYGAQFDERDPGTFTSQKTVVEWLQATIGLSEREAQSVDIVTRPDSARRR
jgi:hypothetical protein